MERIIVRVRRGGEKVEVPFGHSSTPCEECGELILLARLEAVPGATRCARCQEKVEPPKPPIKHVPFSALVICGELNGPDTTRSPSHAAARFF